MMNDGEKMKKMRPCAMAQGFDGASPIKSNTSAKLKGRRFLALALVLCMALALLPAAALATEEENDPGVDVTVQAPDGYTTDKNGIMAYKELSENAIDVMGYYKDNWIKTTYSCYGYEVVNALGGGTLTSSAGFINDGRYVQLSYTVTAGEEPITNGKFVVHADVKIGDNDRAAIEVIRNGDGEVTGLRMVDDDQSNPSYGSQFNLYFADAGGVTDVSTYWFGYYNSRKSNVYNQLNGDTESTGNYAKEGDAYTGFSGADSGIAFSWQGINLAPGASQTFSVILGVGEKSDPPAWDIPGDGISPISLTLDAQQQNSVKVGAKVAHVEGQTMYLYYDVDGGASETLGAFTQDTDVDTIEETLNVSALGDGEHTLRFWVVNSGGAQSDTVKKPITIENGEITDGLDSKAGAEVNDPTGDPGVPPVCYDIKISREGSGTISPDGGTGNTASVYAGANQTFTFTPDKGYVVSDVLVDGQSIGARESHTFERVTGNHTLKVVFTAADTHVNLQTGAAFEDVGENSWFADAVYAAVNNGWFSGTGKTTFSPYGGTTRGMFAAVVWRMENKPAAGAASSFDDVEIGMYYADGVAWAQEKGVVKGYGNGSFGPNDPVTREQLAVILYSLAGSPQTSGVVLSEFTDYGSVSPYAVNAMGWAVEEGIIAGRGGALEPKAGATRAEAAAMLLRYCERS